MAVWVVHAVAVLAFIPSAPGIDRRQGLAYYAIAVTLAAALALLLMPADRWRNLRRQPSIVRLVAATVTLSSLGFVVGVANGNPIGLIVGDSGKLVMTGLLLLVVGASNTLPRRSTVVVLVSLLALQQVGDLIGAYSTQSSGLGRSSQALWPQNLAAIVLATHLLLRSSSVWQAFRWLSLIAFLMLTGVLSVFRTYIALVPLAVASIAFGSLRNRSGRFLRPTIAVAILIVVVVAVRTSVPRTVEPYEALALSVVEQFDTRFSTAASLSATDEASTRQRLVEAEGALDYWASDVFTILIGGGSGTLVPIDNPASEYAAARLERGGIHSIHVSPSSFLARYGLLGLTYWVALLGIAVRGSRPRDASRMRRPWRVISLAYMLISVGFFVLPGDVVFATSIGFLSLRDPSEVAERPDGRSDGVKLDSV